MEEQEIAEKQEQIGAELSMSALECATGGSSGHSTGTTVITSAAVAGGTAYGVNQLQKPAKETGEFWNTARQGLQTMGVKLGEAASAFRNAKPPV